VEEELRVSEIVAKGYDLEIVKKVERLLYIAEYKRRQAAPGVKVTRKNFGRDRRYPIVNRFRDQGLVAHRRDEAFERAIGKPRVGPSDV
jgi:NAD+ synthase